MHSKLNTFEQIDRTHLGSSVGFSGNHGLYAAHNPPVPGIFNIDSITLCQNERDTEMVVEKGWRSQSFLYHGNGLVEYFL